MKFILNEKEDASVVAFNQRDWAEEYNKLSNNIDREAKIYEFIDKFLMAHNLSTNIGFKKALAQQLLLGAPETLSEANNPFLGWIVQFGKKVGTLNEVSDEEYNNLISLYSDSIILDNDLRGTSSLGTQAIIFNSDLFNQVIEDFTYLTQVFYYLNSSNGSRNFLEKYNSMNNSQKNEFFQRLGYPNYSSAKIELDRDNLKYFIIFADKIYKPRGTLRKAKTVSYAISYLDEKVQDTGKGRDETPIDDEFKDKLNQAYKSLTDDFGYKKDLVKSLLDVVVKSEKFDASSELNDIIKFVIKMVGALR